jgi:SAM-dependent methyltransferase
MPFIPAYDALRIHAMMLSDSIRSEAYRRAIESSVRPGDVVIDVGTGTGILALFAAQAGAKRVYAIEPTGITELARQIAHRNGLDARIQFVRANAEEADIPEKADCIVSEWLGVFCLQENMLPCVAGARDRFLKPGGKMLPEAVDLLVALLEDEDLYHDHVARWRQRPYGLDYTDFASCQANDVHVTAISPAALLSDPAAIGHIDMRTAADATFRWETRLRAARKALCHGLAGWFRASFPGGVVLDTAPHNPLTHWQQAFFPFAEPISLTPDEEVRLTLTTEADHKVVHFTWEITAPGSHEPSATGDTRKALFKDT